MSDIVERVQVLIGGNAEGAKKVIREVEEEMKASQRRMKDSSVSVGRDAGDKMGRAFATAQDRWLRVAESGFRRYGGRIGSYVADIIGQFDKISKAREATNNLSRVSGGGGGGGASAAEIAAGSAIGSAAARGGIRNRINRFGTGIYNLAFGSRRPNKGFGESIFDRVRTIASRRRSADARDLIGDMDEPDRVKRAGELLAQNRRGGIRGLIGDLAYQSRVPKVGSVLQSALSKSGGVRGAAGEMLGGVARTGLGIGRMAFAPIGVGALALGGAAIAGGAALYNKGKENRETRKKLLDSEDLVKEIDAIKDPVKKAQKILEEFGENGAGRFRELKEETKSLRESLGSSDWANAAEKIVVGWESITNWLSGIFSPLIKQIGKEINELASMWTGMSDEMVEESQRIEASINRNRRKADKILEDRAKKEKKAVEDKKKYTEGLQKELAAEEAEAAELVKEKISLEQQYVELQQIIFGLSEKKNRSLEEEVMLKKANNEFTKVNSKLEEQRAKDSEKAADAAAKEAQARERISDRSKLGVGDLAKKNTPAGRAAAQVESLEEQAQNARAAGNIGLADRLTGQANNIRGKLGAAGIIKSGEFGDEFPSMPEQSPLTAEQLLSTSNQGYGYMQSQQRQKQADAYSQQGAILKYGNRLGPVGAQLQAAAKKRQAEIAGKAAQKGRGINEYFIENGRLPVEPFNGK